MASVAEVKVFSSPPLRAVLRDLGPQFERTTGLKLVARITAVADLKRQIVSGDAFDVAVLTPWMIDALVRDGRIAAGASAHVARSGLGIAVRAGMRKPDVGSADAFRRTLLEARSVMYASGSAVTMHIEHVFERLGIAAAVKAKAALIPAGGQVGKAIADGVAELGLTHIPVIMDSRGIDLAGPFPPELQRYVDLSAGMSSESREPQGAGALIRYLVAPETAAVVKAKGLEPFDR